MLRIYFCLVQLEELCSSIHILYKFQTDHFLVTDLNQFSAFTDIVGFYLLIMGDFVMIPDRV